MPYEQASDLFWILAFMTPVVLLALIGGIILGAIKIIKGDTKRSRKSSEEEARMIQEIYMGLSSMERRVESLETLLFDRERERGVSNEL
ncbi:MAG: phage-shock protein [Deltaproteobacteria bacterium]|nr:phage-shock protein [Deltaproteobacteria bacterium]